MRKKANYDKKVKLTRILLDDYLVLKQASQRAGVSMAEALHRLIEHQAQLRLPELRVTGEPIFQIEPVTTAYRTEPATAIATNGSKGAAFRIKPKGARHD